MTLSVIGRDKMLAKLNAQIRRIKNRTGAGLRIAVLHVKGKSLEITPKYQGHLQNSCGTQVLKTTSGFSGEIYYTAAYAVFVHEIDKNYSSSPTSRNPRGQWKYLETAMKQEAKEVLHLIQMTVKI